MSVTPESYTHPYQGKVQARSACKIIIGVYELFTGITG